MRRFRSLGRGVLLAACMAASAALATEPLLTRHVSDPATDAKVRMLVERSQKAFEKGDLGVAITEAKTALSIAPLSGLARLQLGICLMQAGDAYNAEDQLRRAQFDGMPAAQVLPHLFEAMLARGEYEQLLDEFPDPGTPPEGSDAADILRARAVAYQGIGKAQDANASMDRSLALMHDRKGIIIRADIALEQGDTKLAKSLSDEVLAANSKDAESIDLKVRVALAMRDINLAVQTADQLVALNPKSLNSRLTRIRVYFAAGMDDKAKSEIDLVNKQYSNLSITAYYRALLLARKGDFDAAWKIGITLPAEFNISSPDVGENMAEMAAHSGHFEPAAAILHAVVAKWPRDIDARLDLVEVRLNQNNYADALSVLLPLEDSKDTLVAMYFARIYNGLHRPQNARKYLDIINVNGSSQIRVTTSPKRAVELLAGWLFVHPEDNLMRRQYAQLLLLLADEKDALVQYEMLLKATPNDVSVLNNLGWLLRDSDPHRALELVSRAAELAPNSANILDTEGWITFKQGNKSSALPLLERAHTLEPANPTIAYHLARVLQSAGRPDEAKALLEGALADSYAVFEDRHDAEQLLASIRRP